MLKILAVGLVLLGWTMQLRAQTAGERAGIEAFNHRFEDATRRMDNSATMELWAQDGVSLLPSTKPITGKAAIRAFTESVTAQLKNARMIQFELRCEGIEVAGNLATEWCDEHQVVQLGTDKPPFDGRGRMLLVLRREAGGRWLLLREMWNQAEGK